MRLLRRRIWLLLVVPAVFGLVVRFAGSAEPGKLAAPPPLPQQEESIEQGVKIAFSQDGRTDVRAARLLSIFVPERHAPTPFLSAGPFTATWSGFLNQRLRNEVTFSVLGRGKVMLKIKGMVVLEAQGEDFAGKSSGAVRLDKGKNPIEVIYNSPQKGDAQLRVIWASRDWPPEPVQPGALSHDVSDVALRAAMRLREGRALLANLRCIKCHDDPVPQLDAGRWNMPELSADAPSTEAIGARLKERWMAAWIADPRALRPDATMPRMFHGEEGAIPQQAVDLAAYLATLGKPAAAGAPAGDDEMVAQGGQLFAALGCIGCHTRPDAQEIDLERGRVPLKWVNAKFQPEALKGWLMAPQAHYQWTRMPDFHLTDFEADRLVAFLLRNAQGELPAAEVKGDVARGQALFASTGCSNCHVTPTLKTRSMKALLTGSDWKRGCLAAEAAARGAAPDFGLSDDQRAALQAIAAAGLSSLHNEIPAEFAERSIRRLQCSACHARDEVDDRWTELADEVADLMPPDMNIEGDVSAENADVQGPRLFVPRGLGKLVAGDQVVISGDQSRPALTWTGEKLRPEWSARFIAGKMRYKPRYWLRARMPAFPMQASDMAAGLALQHGMPPHRSAPPESPEDPAQVGMKLVSRDGGFACIMCHPIGGMKAISPFEAPAPNLIHVRERLTHDYYQRWMRKPMRFWPGTKMPQYSENGKTSLREILEGDADRQFEAIWNYLLEGEGMTPPE